MNKSVQDKLMRYFAEYQASNPSLGHVSFSFSVPANKRAGHLHCQFFPDKSPVIHGITLDANDSHYGDDAAFWLLVLLHELSHAKQVDESAYTIDEWREYKEVESGNVSINNRAIYLKIEHDADDRALLEFNHSFAYHFTPDQQKRAIANYTRAREKFLMNS